MVMTTIEVNCANGQLKEGKLTKEEERQVEADVKKVEEHQQEKKAKKDKATKALRKVFGEDTQDVLEALGLEE